jgi:hypothetical protein
MSADVQELKPPKQRRGGPFHDFYIEAEEDILQIERLARAIGLLVVGDMECSEEVGAIVVEIGERVKIVKERCDDEDADK